MKVYRSDAERAQGAIAEFNKMIPLFETFAQAVYGKRIPVKIPNKNQSEMGKQLAYNDGQTIYIIPPLYLAEVIEHDKQWCGSNTELGVSNCPACARFENIFSSVCHEIAHFTGGSMFLDNRDYVVRSRAKSLSPSWGMAIMYMLEDVRIEDRMFRAQAGTKTLRYSVFSSEIAKQLNDDVPLNSWAMIATLASAMGYNYIQYPKQVQDYIADKGVQWVIEKAKACTGMEQIIELIPELVVYASKYDIFQEPKDEEEPEENNDETDQEPESGNDDEDSEDSESEEFSESEADSNDGSPDGNHDGESSDSESEQSSNDSEDDEDSSDNGNSDSKDDSLSNGTSSSDESSSNEDSREGDDDSETSDDSGSSGDRVDNEDSQSEDGEESPETEEDQDSSETSGPRSSPDPDEEADEENSNSDGDGSSESEDDSSDDESEGADGDSDGSTDSSESHTENGSASEDGEGEESDDSSESPGGDGDDSIDSGSDATGGLSSEPSDPTGDIDAQPSTGNAPESNLAPSGTNPEPAEESEDKAEPDSGENDIDFNGEGTEEEAIEMLRELMGHSDFEDGTQINPEAFRQVATAYEAFGESSGNVTDLVEFKYSGDEWGVWNNGKPVHDRYDALHTILKNHDRYGEEDREWWENRGILEGALSKMRVVFAENDKSKNAENLKSGKVNTRSLGKRAPIGDSRLFKKKSFPKKRDYAVLIMGDMSGSTGGENLNLELNAVSAQAELLNRMGIPFSVIFHSGDYSQSYKGTERYRRGEGTEEYAWVKAIVKDWNDPWSRKQQSALKTLFPFAANLDGHAMNFARKEILRQKATDLIVMYYSDGKMPLENYNDELRLLQSELKILRQAGVTVVGVGINTDSPTKHGLPTVMLESEKDVSKVVDFLEKLLLNKRG